MRTKAFRTPDPRVQARDAAVAAAEPRIVALSPDDGDNGVDAGKVAAISVACVAGIVIVVAVGVALFLHLRKRDGKVEGKPAALKGSSVLEEGVPKLSVTQNRSSRGPSKSLVRSAKPLSCNDRAALQRF